MEKEGLVSNTRPSTDSGYHTFLPWKQTNMTSPSNTENSSQTPHHHHQQQEQEDEREQASVSTPAPLKRPPLARRLLTFLRKNLLVLLLILALLLGILLGGLLRLRDEPYTDKELLRLRFPGDLLMNMLQLLILPLIVSSLISGMTSLDAGSFGNLGFRAVLYYLISMLTAVVLGVVLVVSLQPGNRGGGGEIGGGDEVELHKVEPVDALLDLFRQMFPNNIVEATFQKTLTRLVEKPLPAEKKNGSAAFPGNNITAEPNLVPVLQKEEGMNMLGLVVFSVALGIAINHVGPKGLPLKALFRSLADVTMVLVTVVIWYSPIGMLFLLMAQVVSLKDPMQTFEQLSFFFLTVTAGLTVHSLVTLPLLYFVVCRRNPYTFMFGVLEAMVTALGTSSSAATLPVTMRNLEENNGVDPRVVGFVAPVGATVNMDGTALYEAVAVIFIGQMEGFHMDIGTVIIICLTSTAAAIGAAGVPQAGLVTMVIVLTAAGFPTDKVGLVLAIDWLVDRLRTVVNVLGDAFGAGIVQHLSRKDLARMDEEESKAVAAAAAAAAAVTTSNITSNAAEEEEDKFLTRKS